MRYLLRPPITICPPASEDGRPTLAAEQMSCLPSHGDLLAVLIAHRAALHVTVVEHDGDGGLGHARLPLLVDQLLQAAGADLGRKARQRGGAFKSWRGVQVESTASRDGQQPRGRSARSAPERAQREEREHSQRRAWERLVMPRTKQMLSRMLLLPLPLRPVMALKKGSKAGTTVRCAYDLKPSTCAGVSVCAPVRCLC